MRDILPKQTILIVDDVAENIDILNEILQENYKIKAARNGKTALEIAWSNHPPDLILLDIMMPGINGYDVCKQLKENKKSKKIPVIFVTSKGEVEDETLGFEVGAVDYITKPISPSIVRERVKTHLALYDQNRILAEKVHEKTLQLRKAYEAIKTASLDTIYRLSRAAEFKDEDTGEHIQRISHYAAAVARRMGLKEKTVELILYAAPMHDIGKIGIPDKILLKPGKLDSDEWKIMAQHTLFGAQILEDSQKGFLKIGWLIALTHHEKWDGSGYPRGLKGKKIPLIGRIVAVCDVFDALISKRPYKEPFSIEKSFSIIKKGRGCDFDPAVVDAFFEAENEIRDTKELFADKGKSLLTELAGND